MKTDVELRSDAMRILREQLGLVEAERFLAMVGRESFDYTKWRQDQWNDLTVTEIAERARKMRENQDASH
ncbi:MAG: hypothetical protein U0936_07190 [Planctomycetaceae bacterium]